MRSTWAPAWAGARRWENQQPQQGGVQDPHWYPARDPSQLPAEAAGLWLARDTP